VNRRPREFSAFYDAHVLQVYGFFAYRVASREEAEDLCQLTFERALRAWSRYDAHRSSPATWLLAIARNLLIDDYRRGRAARERPIGEVEEAVLPADAAEPWIGLDAPLERAVAALAPRSRELIALRYGADLAGTEIAAITGLSLANVQQILSRALRQMRDELGDGYR
jgi:RNA polymerase sigma-70 factor (ECF subfamily)